MDFSSTIGPNFVGDNESLMQFQAHYLWALIVGFHLSFTFAFAMGANEVSNAFATSVASGAINLTIAYFLATFVESAGGVLLGYKVLETLRFKVIDLSMYENAPNELLLGQVAILGGSACWMLLSVLAKLPVSSTHSHVGSIIGFSLVMRGSAGLHIENVVKIVISWIASPVISGIISAILYIIFDHAVLRRKNPLMAGFRALPFFYFAVFTFITFIVIYQGSKWIHFDKTPFWLALCVSLTIGIFAAIIFQFLVRPFLIKWVQKNDKTAKSEELPEASGQHSSLERIHSAPSESSSPEQLGQTSNRTHRQHRRQTIEYTPKGFLGWLLPNGHRKDAPQTLRLFSAIQVFTACFTGFSHGSKDIPNTIAPLATLLFVFSTAKVPSLMETDLWILFYGSLGTCVGFWIMGHRVIETVGTEFTKIDPPSGFTIELGSAITVVIASKLGIPIALTLCIVGSIVAVGAVRGSVPVNWGLFRNVFLTWLLTFPVSGIFAAFLMFILKFFFL